MSCVTVRGMNLTSQTSKFTSSSFSPHKVTLAETTNDASILVKRFMESRQVSIKRAALVKEVSFLVPVRWEGVTNLCGPNSLTILEITLHQEVVSCLYFASLLI